MLEESGIRRTCAAGNRPDRGIESVRILPPEPLGGRRLRTVLAALLCAATIGCGSDDGGGGGPTPPPPDAPTATIAFPADGTLTDAAEVTVRGSATDDEGVASVRVNGVDALSGDGFATWSASVPIELGTNELVVSATSTTGATNESAASVELERANLLFEDPVGVVLDGFANRALVVDAGLRAVIAVDWTSGARSILSGEGVGAGPDLVAPRGILRSASLDWTFVADAGAQAILRVGSNGARSVLANGPLDPFRPEDVCLGLTPTFVYAAEPGPARVDEIDTGSGIARPLSGDGAGFGPDFELPAGLVVDAFAFRLLVVDPVAQALFAVRFDTGERSIVSQGTTGGGVDFGAPAEVDFDRFTYRALVADPGRRAVIGVQLASGFRNELSGPSSGSGIELVRPVDLSFFFGTNQLAVLDGGLDALLRVDPQSGARTLVAGDFVGDGSHMDRPRGVALGASSDSVLVADAGLATVWHVSLSSGDRTLVTGPSLGAGPELVSPIDVAPLSDSTALVLDEGLAAVVSIDLGNGARTQLEGTGPELVDPLAIELPPGAMEALVTDGDGALYALDPTTGDRSELSGPGVGSGPGFVHPIASARSSDFAEAWTIDEGADAVFVVDLASGARSILSGPTNEPSFAGAEFADVVLDAANDRLLVAIPTLPALVAIDLATGERSAIEGSGPALLAAASLALDADGNAFVADAAHGALLAIDPASGARVLRSK